MSEATTPRRGDRGIVYALLRALWRGLIRRTPLDWLTWQSALLVAALFVGGKAAERVVLGRRWHSFGRLDLAELLVLALAVGAFTWYVHRRMRREMDRAEEQRRRAEALAAENAAVVRAVGALLREFAQPLSGALSYSEMLMARDENRDADERYEMARLRDGVLRLENLLQTVRHTLDCAPASNAPPHLADVVEDSVAPAHARSR